MADRKFLFICEGLQDEPDFPKNQKRSKKKKTSSEFARGQPVERI